MKIEPLARLERHAKRIGEIAAVLGPKKAEVVNRTQGELSERLAQYGIVVKQFTINELHAPESVIEAINQKNVMQQQAFTA